MFVVWPSTLDVKKGTTAIFSSKTTTTTTTITTPPCLLLLSVLLLDLLPLGSPRLVRYNEIIDMYGGEVPIAFDFEITIFNFGGFVVPPALPFDFT